MKCSATASIRRRVCAGARGPIFFWTKRQPPNSADSIESLTYYLWLTFRLLVDSLRVYGVDVAAGAVLFAVVSLWPAARGYRRNKRMAPVFAWGALSFGLMALAAISLYLHFHSGDL